MLPVPSSLPSAKRRWTLGYTRRGLPILLFLKSQHELISRVQTTVQELTNEVILIWKGMLPHDADVPTLTSTYTAPK